VFIFTDKHTSLCRGSQAADFCRRRLPTLLLESLQSTATPHHALKMSFLMLEQGKL
jgi:hypothetical protein